MTSLLRSSRASPSQVLLRSSTTRLLQPRVQFHIGLRETTASRDALQTQKQNLRTQGVHPVGLHTPIFQIYGSNTDIGKTIISAGIVRGALASGNGRVGYIKPLQTGTDDDQPDGFLGDAAFVKKHALLSADSEARSALLDCSTLFSWKTPVSPHLAAAMEGHTITDDALVELLTTKLKTINAQHEAPYSLALVETAGGVCSPSASMRFQADVYRGLRLPVVLIGDGKLGGISSTMSALESLLLRGYDVAALCLIEQEKLDNAEALEPRMSELGIPIFTMQPVPPQPEPLDQWFEEHETVFKDINACLQGYHKNRLERFEHVHARAEEVFWWPFTQHKKYGQLSIIDSAHGDEFTVLQRESNSLEPMFDACASWWTQGIGHGNSKMATSLAYTAARYGHVMFPENAHEPALQLSEKLLESVGKAWASRVYFSDDGSTAVEVGLKMAFRKYLTDHKLDYNSFTSKAVTQKKLVVLAQANCYHGDTLGVMNIAEPSVYNEKQHPWYRPEGIFLKTPSLAIRDGKYTIAVDEEISSGGRDGVTTGEKFSSLADAFNFSNRSADLAETYRKYVAQQIDAAQSSGNGNVLVGALLIEPVLIGAGGMVLVDPLFQRVVVEECRARKIPVIFDEVFSGWWRLGVESGRDLLGVNPDIACYAKLLTGGVVPLAVTLASEDIFETFYDDGKGEALLHGHSFTAHPIGCAAALTSLDMYSIMNEAGNDLESNVTREYWNADLVSKLSELSHVARTFSIGTVVGIELQTSNAGYASSEAQDLIRVLRKNEIYARALGNVVYMMCSPLTSQEDCDRYLRKLHHHLAQYKK
ncbi:Dethiobiotin synthase, partial [Globisporangium splendens]